MGPARDPSSPPPICLFQKYGRVRGIAGPCCASWDLPSPRLPPDHIYGPYPRPRDDDQEARAGRVFPSAHWASSPARRRPVFGCPVPAGRALHIMCRRAGIKVSVAVVGAARPHGLDSTVRRRKKKVHETHGYGPLRMGTYTQPHSPPL